MGAESRLESGRPRELGTRNRGTWPRRWCGQPPTPSGQPRLRRHSKGRGTRRRAIEALRSSGALATGSEKPKRHGASAQPHLHRSSQGTLSRSHLCVNAQLGALLHDQDAVPRRVVVSALGVATASTRQFTTTPDSHAVCQGRRRKTVSYHFLFDRPTASSVQLGSDIRALSRPHEFRGRQKRPRWLHGSFRVLPPTHGRLRVPHDVHRELVLVSSPSNRVRTADTATTGRSRPG